MTLALFDSRFSSRIGVELRIVSDYRIERRHSTVFGPEAAKTLDEKKLQRLVDENIKGKQLDFVILHDLANTAGHTDNIIIGYVTYHMLETHEYCKTTCDTLYVFSVTEFM